MHPQSPCKPETHVEYPIFSSQLCDSYNWQKVWILRDSSVCTAVVDYRQKYDKLLKSITQNTINQVLHYEPDNKNMVTDDE